MTETVFGMPNVNFYLKKPSGKLPYALIYLQFKYKGRKLVYSFGEKINPPDWSKELQRVKSNRHTILDGRYAINDLLDKLEKECLRLYHEESEKGAPPVPVLKFRLDAFLGKQAGKNKGSAFYELIDRFICGEIKSKGREKSRNTLKNYATTKTHLHAFDIQTRYHIHFENINLDFFQRYTSFLKDILKLKPNSIARDIGVLKTVMTEAVDLGYTSNIQFRHKTFRFAAVETDAVHLSEQEITRLYRLDCSADRRLERVRDLFVFSCLTGWHYRYKKLNIKQIDGKSLIALPAAGPGAPVMIPCHPFIPEILTKYQEDHGHLPKAPSIQKFNDYIKEVCRLAGLVEKGRLSTAPGLALWQCISSRTSRITMAAHYYREGYPVYDLMRVTGHSTEKAFLKFIRAVPEPS